MTSTTAPLTDTRVMGVIHTIYRREFRLAGGLVRGVEPGDVARARLVGNHLRLVHDNLHHHHSAEDELLWPLVLDRVPQELAPLVHLMERQHAVVEGLLDEIGSLLPGWTKHAGLDEREALADLHDQLHQHLTEHMDAEEEQLLPIAARNVNQSEWDAMGEAARANTQRSEFLLVLGMIIQDGDPEIVAHMLAAAPTPVRWLLLKLGRRAYRRHARAVHGTTTP